MKSYDSTLKNWLNKEKDGVSLLKTVANLMYDKGVELVLFRNHLLEIGISELMSLFSYANKVVNRKVDIKITNEIAKEISSIDLPPSKIDIGLLTAQFSESSETNLRLFLENKLSKIMSSNLEFSPKDVVLFGFGRIGRLVARELIKQAGKGQQLRLKGIVVRNISNEQMIKRCDLFRNDSVHGAYKADIDLNLKEKCLTVNGQRIYFIEGKNPSEINYNEYGINDALLIDNSGAFTDKDSLSNHLESIGISKVLLTAPGKGIPNIVYGINSKELDIENSKIVSAASCTTNCIAPILHVIESEYGITSGHLETVHSYTNDQNLIDNMHKKARRGRSAAINMVITTTGAGKAVTKVIPSLEGKLTANAVRVPTPNVSLAILKLKLKKKTSVNDINNTMKKAALKGSLVNQINYQVDPDLVSTDIIGNNCCAVFDSSATIVDESESNTVLYTWYDNEFGYTKQVIRLAKFISGVRRLTYY